jgi:hypothetical protein
LWRAKEDKKKIEREKQIRGTRVSRILTRSIFFKIFIYMYKYRNSLVRAVEEKKKKERNSQNREKKKYVLFK